MEDKIYKLMNGLEGMSQLKLRTLSGKLTVCSPNLTSASGSSEALHCRLGQRPALGA